MTGHQFGISTRYGREAFVCSLAPSRIRLYSPVIGSPYLGHIAPVAFFTAREVARGVYAGVFGRAVLTTLSIGLPRPFLLRAADIGPTVKTHCLFPPPLREPDGHATYTETRGDHGGGALVCLIPVAVVLSRAVPRAHDPIADASIPPRSLVGRSAARRVISGHGVGGSIGEFASGANVTRERDVRFGAG